MLYSGEGTPKGYEYPIPDNRGGATVAQETPQKLPASVLKRLKEAARTEKLKNQDPDSKKK